jgi:hypothetical protein
MPRLQAPGGTVHAVGRRNNGAFYFTMPEDFRIVLIHPDELTWDSGYSIEAEDWLAETRGLE